MFPRSRAALVPLLLLAAPQAPTTTSPSTPSASTELHRTGPALLAERLAEQIEAAARRAAAHRVHLDLQPQPGLEGAPALTAISRELSRVLFDSASLAEAAGAEPADLDVVITLSRLRGQVAIGGPVQARGVTVDWVLATADEAPDWWPWLLSFNSAPATGGFAWRRVGSLADRVEDADSGDVDGDGEAEFAVATAHELLVFRSGPGVVVPVARTTLDDAEAHSSVATRAPRTFLRISAAAGGPGEILVRRTDEARTRVYGWAGGTLVRRSDRDGLILASRADVTVTAALQPGTNALDGAPVIHHPGARALAALPWVDLRPAALTATAFLVEGVTRYGALEGSTLRLFRGDGTETGRLPHCGAAYALADLDGDGLIDTVCSQDGSGPDRLTVFLGSHGMGTATWTTSVEGEIAAIAAGPGAGGPSALVFAVPPAGGTEIWSLVRAR